MLYCIVGHTSNDIFINCGNIGASAIGTVEQLSNECRKGEHLGLQGLLMSWLGDYLGCHWCSYRCRGSHAELLDDLGDILLLAELRNHIIHVFVDFAPKQPGG